MKRIVWITLFTVISSSPGARALSQDELRASDKEPRTEATESSEDAEESLSELTVPGEPHELLAGTVGDWSLTIRVWTAPDTEPVESTGSATGRWFL